ncbi:hypothetical protein E6W39_12475 [Kitasatospora acidiphila]|uniref:Uncharacterized protein n=1 Tax=Kitasatospora acidiphila TaxID=2567942 RepID=A0A540W1N5_9ACTN|nr:hypothetical protein [Kitasatospora acidiphila]TQF02921.1 hypothetical protein E6W39_12475 [Kitasatospora acidiphila]
MNLDRDRRAALCSALPWLTEDLAEQGRAAELAAAVRAVLADVPVLVAVAALGIPQHVLDETGPVRGEEPGPGDMIGARPRAAGESYRCPDGWCSLSLVREPGGPVPAGGRCWLRDRALLVTEA